MHLCLIKKINKNINNNRLCYKCNDHKSETLFHFLVKCKCNDYLDIRIERNDSIRNIYNIYNNQYLLIICNDL